MNVFITGGTGFVGKVVVAELVRAGHRVTALARSDTSARALLAAGAEVQRGDLADLDGLRRGALAADRIVHAAFELDLSDWAKGGELDRRAIEAMGAAIAGSDRHLVVTSGAFALDVSGVATEADNTQRKAVPRVTEPVTDEAAARGARVSLVRLGVVHGDADRHFLPGLIAIARSKGVSAYVDDGAQRWPVVNVLDTGSIFRLAIEKGKPGARYHAIAEEGVPVRAIAEVIARKLGVPLVSQTPEEAVAHFGPMAMFAAADRPTSSTRTRAELGWTPEHRGLLDDLEHGTYFQSAR